MKKKIVLIGSNGFIGSQIKNKLSEKKLINLNSKNMNLFKKKSINKVAHKFKNSIIIYSAGKKRTRGDTYVNFQTNIDFFFNLLHFLSINKPKKVIFLSSIEVYGDYKGSKKIDEKTEVKPKTLYSLAKLIQEQALKFFAAKHKFDYLILRLPGIYGKDLENSSIVNKLILSLDKKHTFILKSSGDELRDYVFVKDVANFINHVIKKNVKNLTINLVTGEPLKLKKIINLIEKNFNKKLFIIKKKINSFSEINLNFQNKLVKRICPKFKFTSLNNFNFQKEF